MANQYVVTSGKVATASAALKVAAQIATASTMPALWIAWDVTFDGTDPTKTPILCEIVKTTSASSTGGTAPTPAKWGATQTTALSSARINDTTDGGSPSVLASWLVPTTGGFSYQFPLGRELYMPVSTFYEMRLTTVSGSATPNYVVNVFFEE